MFALIVRFKAIKGKEKDMEHILRKVIEKVRQNEKDTLFYDMHRKIDDPTEIVFYERYTNRDAWEVTHCSQPYIKGLLGELADHMECEIQITEYELIEAK
jgi:quinol monooxygenase YgiN